MNGYSKGISMQVVRIIHRITIGRLTTAKVLREYLANVPDDATLDGLVPEGESGAEGESVIVFCEEQKVDDE